MGRCYEWPLGVFDSLGGEFVHDHIFVWFAQAWNFDAGLHLSLSVLAYLSYYLYVI